MKVMVTGGFICDDFLLQNMSRSQRNDDGTFKQVLKPFSLDNFNDGWIDTRGRFRVYLPNHPRAGSSGHILRSIVAYEAYHGIEVPTGMAIHHRDKDRLNDTKENLEMMIHGEHTTLHCRVPEAHITRVCQYCKKEFIIKRWRLKGSSRGKYCSQTCYHTHNQGQKHHNYNRVTTICEYCEKSFEHIPSRKLRFCGHRCAAKYNWEKRRRN